MTIGIVGLGLIGGSLAKALKASGNHRVLGYNRSENIIKDALAEGAIDEALERDNLSQCDVVLISLYPDDAINYIEANGTFMKKGAIVMDCCGTKRKICASLEEAAAQNGFYFVGGHPMAGIEKSGFANSFSTLFKNASLILTPYENTPSHIIDTLIELSKEIGFGSVCVTTPEEHDRMIAYTSQLAHAVSCAYIDSPLAEKTRGFSAGSFRDMTRVARLNEQMWAQLFLENANELCGEIDAFCQRLQALRKTISSGDYDELISSLRRSKTAKENLDA